MIESRYIDSIGNILQAVPPAIQTAWERYRDARGKDKEIEQEARNQLKRACRDQGMRGYYPVGGWLVGWLEGRCRVVPDRAGLEPRTDLDRVWFKQIYKRDHANFCNDERVVA